MSADFAGRCEKCGRLEINAERVGMICCGSRPGGYCDGLLRPIDWVPPVEEPKAKKAKTK